MDRTRRGERPALLWEPGGDGGVVCGLCARRCTIAPGRRGWCMARENAAGELRTLVYGELAALEARPMEIKPFYHYHPGKTSETFSTISCNLNCDWCQNHHISGADPGAGSLVHLEPGDLVDRAAADGCAGLCGSFAEPTLMYEFCLDAFRLARDRGMFSCFVTNGYMTAEALKGLADAGMTGMSVDLKGGPEAYREYCHSGDIGDGPVWDTIASARELGVHVEVVCLVVPGVSDTEEGIRGRSRRLLETAGPDVPLHFSAYHPERDFTAPPTPIPLLERARDIAVEEGLRFVYLGNVVGHDSENTYCPRCKELVLARRGIFFLEDSRGEGGGCPNCGAPIPIVE